MKARLISLLAFAAANLVPAAALAGGAQSSQSLSAEPTAHPGTRLILLGTAGGPVVSIDRSQPATLLVVDGRPYLIDCGDGTARQLKKAGFAATDISHVFLTHLHIDHTAGLASLMAFNWVSGKRQVMQIYGPPGTSELARKATDYLTIPAEIHGVVMPPHPALAKIVESHDLDVDQETLVFEDGKLRVFAVTNSHYVTTQMPLRDYGHDQSYSYRFETADKTIVFTGDTGPSAAVEALARNADILVSEIIDIDATTRMLKQQYPVTDDQLAPLLTHMIKEHLVPDEVGKLATRAHVGMVILSHIAPVTDELANPPQYTRKIRKFFKGPIIMGRDFEEF
jgi:ribonuclease BN (tRNA processing enzyme)